MVKLIEKYKINKLNLYQKLMYIIVLIILYIFVILIVNLIVNLIFLIDNKWTFISLHTKFFCPQFFLNIFIEIKKQNKKKW